MQFLNAPRHEANPALKLIAKVFFYHTQQYVHK